MMWLGNASRVHGLRNAGIVGLLLAAVASLVQGQTVTEFTIPTSGSRANGIVAGPDGAIWFTETGGNKIGRITTAGVITEFPLSIPNSGPSGIVAGPDVALWFTEASPGRIG